MKRNWKWLTLAAALACLLAYAVACEGDDDDDDDNDDDNDDTSDEFSVLSVQPATGPVAGGTAVVVYGRGFEEGCTLYFGDAEAVDLEYTARTELSAKTPPSPTGGNGPVNVRVENPDGEYAELENGFYYGEAGVTVGWCVVKWPESTATQPGVPTEMIYGQVYVEGCTESQGEACASLTAQVGWGQEGIDPSVDASLFDWVDATYNGDFWPEEGSDAYNNDEFQAQITESDEGTYRYAYRFSGDGGATWTYCDTGLGTDDGFSPSAMGLLTVSEQTYTIGWCIVQYPAETTTQPGVASENIYGRVYVEGCTDGDAHCAAVAGQVGYGPAGANPSTSPESFDWINAGYNGDHTDDNNDEYAAQITEGDEGDYKYAYRFTVDGGDTYTYCDLDGTDNGFATDQMGTLHVTDTVYTIGWCSLHYPPTATTTVGVATEQIYGRVYIAGITGQGSAPAGVAAQVGFAAQGSNPTTDPGDFTWTAATFNVSVGNDDEFWTPMTPLASGTYGYAYRFSVNGSVWSYCDLDGLDNGFALDQMGTMYVTDK